MRSAFPRVLVACALASLFAHTPEADAKTAAKTDRLMVFAAASLTESFGELGARLEKSHPGLEVRFSFAGSQQLEAQLEQGARADVFASADDRWMSVAAEHRLLAGDPQVFAHNRLIVIVPRTNPARIDRLQDLAHRGVKLVLAAQTVPAGEYGRQLLANLARAPGYPADFATRTLANVVSEEDNVRSVVSKVQLGEADAGICYVSDATGPVARHVRVFTIPEGLNVLATYPIAALAGAADTDAARAFIDLVFSPEGQAVLARHAFLPAKAPGD